MLAIFVSPQPVTRPKYLEAAGLGARENCRRSIPVLSGVVTGEIGVGSTANIAHFWSSFFFISMIVFVIKQGF